MAKAAPPLLKQIKNTPVKEINYETENTISFSQYSIFSKCNHRWSLEYRDNHRIYLPSIDANFGTAIHRTIQHYLETLYNISGTAANNIDLNNYFQEAFIEEYQKTVLQNNEQHFSSAEELGEYYEDGVCILDYLKNNRNEYFSIRGWDLVGIEMPLIQAINDQYSTVYLKGYIDLVLYHKESDTIKIIDIKTSRQGWKDKDKNDPIKIQQLILYKEYFSRQYNISPDKIEIEFFIVKRKLYSNPEYPQKRIQLFHPLSGKIKTRKTLEDINNFIKTVFNTDGSYKDTMYDKNISSQSCKFCPFKDNNELCSKN